jgi:glycerol uptake facilitator-like aquaporin
LAQNKIIQLDEYFKDHKVIYRIFISEFLGSLLLLSSLIFLNSLKLDNIEFGAIVGLLVLTLVHVFGPISGAHFNPLITLGFVLMGDLKGRIFIIVNYIFPQILSAIIITIYLKFLNIANFDINIITMNAPNYITEMLGTFFLLLGIFELSSNGKLCPETKPFTGIAVGCLLASILILLGSFGAFLGNPGLLIIGLYGYATADWSFILLINVFGGIAAYLTHRILH